MSIFNIKLQQEYEYQPLLKINTSIIFSLHSILVDVKKATMEDPRGRGGATYHMRRMGPRPASKDAKDVIE